MSMLCSFPAWTCLQGHTARYVVFFGPRTMVPAGMSPALAYRVPVFTSLVPSARTSSWTNTGVFLSSDQGTHWSASDSTLKGAYVYAIASAGSRLYAGTFFRGVFVSTDGGSTWASPGTGLADRVVTALAVSGSRLIAGTHNAGVFISTMAVHIGLPPASVFRMSTSVRLPCQGRMFLPVRRVGCFFRRTAPVNGALRVPA